MKTKILSPKRTYQSSRTAGNSPGEKNTGISLTVPDQSYTVREILTKFASGTLPNIANDITYSEDMPDIRGLDISELHAMKQDARSDVSRLQEEGKKLEQKQKTPPKPPKPPTTTPILTDVEPQN